MLQVVEELEQLYRQPIQVYNAHTEQHESYYVILSTMMADAPGRKKVSDTGGHNSVFSCLWCVTEGLPFKRPGAADAKGKKGKGKTTLYPAGYIEPTPI